MSSLAERLAGVRRQAEQAPRDNPAPAAAHVPYTTNGAVSGAPCAPGGPNATAPGPAGSGPAAGSWAGPSAGLSSGGSHAGGGESEARRRPTPKPAEPGSRRRGMSSDPESI